MYITVVGGGNSTPIFAALAADAGHEVAILIAGRRLGARTSAVPGDPGYMGRATELRKSIALVTADPAECIRSRR